MNIGLQGTRNDCALIELPSANSPLEFKLRALDPDGFLNSWSLTAVKGSNHGVGLTDGATSAAPGGAYPGEIVDAVYDGTSERPSADIDGYVTLSVAPSVGNAVPKVPSAAGMPEMLSLPVISEASKAATAANARWPP